MNIFANENCSWQTYMMKKRNYIFTKINNSILEISNDKAFMSLATFLRKEFDLTGTKVVCAEGDCGACTVLIGKEINNEGVFTYKSINSCLYPLYLLDGAHVVTVEGLKNESSERTNEQPNSIEHLSEVQKQMIACHGTQCGYCTPGFICSMTWMAEKLKIEKKEINEKRARNFLTGNLCRCTGYDPIIKASLSIDLQKVVLLRDRFSDHHFLERVRKIKKDSLVLISDKTNIILPTSLEEALLLKETDHQLKVVAGNTDLGVRANKGWGIVRHILSLTHIEELNHLKLDDDFIYVGATVTLSELEDFIKNHVLELKKLLHIFASPQIKNQGTLIGNVLNASPIGDTIPFLMSSHALIVVESTTQKREVPIRDFYLGYKKLDLAEWEIVTGIKIPRLKDNEKMSLYKTSMRKDLDISSVTFAGKIKIENNIIKKIALSYGGVGPVVISLVHLENKVIDQKFSKEIFDMMIDELPQLISPLSDLRGSAEYRLRVAQNFLRKFFREISDDLNIGTKVEI